MPNYIRFLFALMIMVGTTTSTADAHGPDPGAPLLREARLLISRGDFVGAASALRQLAESHPDSEHLPEAFYWRAAALYRCENEDDLVEARECLEQLATRYPGSPLLTESIPLATRLARKLDEIGSTDQANEARRLVEALRSAVNAQSQAGE